MTVEWFRNKTWDADIKADFLNKLQLAEHNMQITALKIQGDQLLMSNDAETQQAGIELLEMVFNDYPDETYEIVVIKDILGEYYYKKAAFEEAERWLQAVVDFSLTFKRIGITRRADLMLAETILLRQQTARLEEARQLILNYPEMDGSLTEDHEQHYYNELLAHVYYQSGRKKEAAGYALKAIQIAENIELDFMLGKPAAIEKCYEQLPDLQQIAAYESI